MHPLIRSTEKYVCEAVYGALGKGIIECLFECGPF